MSEDLQLLEPQQVADLLRVDVQFVYQRIKTGAIEVVRIGRLPRITRDGLRRFIAESEIREEIHQRELASRSQAAAAIENVAAVARAEQSLSPESLAQLDKGIAQVRAGLVVEMPLSAFNGDDEQESAPANDVE